MEFRLRSLGFKEFFAKQQSSGSWENEMNRKLFCKKLHETQGLHSKFYELNIHM